MSREVTNVEPQRCFVRTGVSVRRCLFLVNKIKKIINFVILYRYDPVRNPSVKISAVSNKNKIGIR